MGLLISRFWRKPTTIEQLELLELKIQKIEMQGKWTDRRHKQVRATVLPVSVGISLLCALAVYICIGTDGRWPETIFYGIPLVALPILVVLVRRIVSWYYSRKLKKDMPKLNEMQSQRTILLEEVMDKETYKVAKQILDKFVV